MMKPRDPSTNAWAAARVIQLVGAEVAAEAIERSVGLIYQWADPDNPAQPVLWQAQRLDDVCSAHGETPFHDVWSRRRIAPRPTGQCPLELAIQADGDMAALVSSTHHALTDGRIDAAERMELNQIIARIRAHLTAVDAEVNGAVREVS